MVVMQVKTSLPACRHTASACAGCDVGMLLKRGTPTEEKNLGFVKRTPVQIPIYSITWLYYGKV